MGTDIHGVFQRRTISGWEDIPTNFKFDRHYLLFAWLGNVRNGYGFAGVPTHTAITPLSDSRGFPADFQVEEDLHRIPDNAFRGDMAEYYKSEDADPSHPDHLQLWMGDHSHSWLSANEILSVKPPTILRTGIITIEQFHSWDGQTSPAKYCGGISGPNVVVSSPSDIGPKTTHVQVEWFEDCRESLSYFIDEVQRLVDEHRDVRFVFGFDS